MTSPPRVQVKKASDPASEVVEDADAQLVHDALADTAGDPRLQHAEELGEHGDRDHRPDGDEQEAHVLMRDRIVDDLADEELAGQLPKIEVAMIVTATWSWNGRKSAATQPKGRDIRAGLEVARIDAGGATRAAAGAGASSTWVGGSGADGWADGRGRHRGASHPFSRARSPSVRRPETDS